MAEFQALLRWYQANGTWPKRTIKVGLFDAEETGLAQRAERGSSSPHITPSQTAAPSRPSTGSRAGASPFGGRKGEAA